ncbi:transglutaminase-like domain-containing protein [Methanotorris igneus]|uniref:Transglutaminase-like domain-containing protein n=1 Tax=Methanotorris igneus (strain DSM 5666 / JCM 11834 / Kol 5) TaxID=880724 RepID=F6BB51_METIK|nr:transglutaminase-like domain-containing protein [Methanotorris igneus]AEF95936.1 protein of unknown function DUF553 [Methanotorris igneus Kol 5]
MKRKNYKKYKRRKNYKTYKRRKTRKSVLKRIFGKINTFASLICIGIFVGVLGIILIGNHENKIESNNEYYGMNDKNKYVISEITNALNKNELQTISHLASQLKGRDISESIWNIILWEEENIKYDYPGKHRIGPYVKYPSDTLESSKGICIDYAVLTAGLLLDMGYEPYIILIDEKHDSGHAFCAVNISGTLYALDQHAPIYDINTHIHHLMLNHTISPIFEIHYFKLWIENDDIKYKYGKLYYNNPNNVLTRSDKEKISKDIMNYFISKYPNLKPDKTISNMEHEKYLPKGYSSGLYIYMPFDALYPAFGKYYGAWLDRCFTKEDELRTPINFRKYNRIWVKVDNKRIWVYLAKK